MAAKDERGAAVEAFHRSLPGFRQTPLLEVERLAPQVGAERAFVKHEQERLGLPSFKVLGASWAINCELARRAGEPPPRDFAVTRHLAAALPAGTTLSTATEGNHGHGVAHVARLLGLRCQIYVPAGTAPARVGAIEDEGAAVAVVDGSYDDAVRFAAAEAERDPAAVLVSDTSWPGYERIPREIGEGYGTIFREAYAQLGGLGGPPFEAVFVPAGVGALAAAAVLAVRPRGAAVFTVEPTGADCVRRSLAAGERVTVPGPHDSVMAGLNCGEVSAVAWPLLRDGVETALAVDDAQTVAAMRLLDAAGIRAGASGAAPLAGATALARDGGAVAGRRWRSLLLVASEGVTDPDGHAALLSAPS